MNEESHFRKIKSFVRRDSRITPAQKNAIDLLWPEFGMQMNTPLAGPLVLEIGFGSGTSLLAAAIAHPELNFIGIETHLPGIGALLLRIQENGVRNIRIFYADAVEVLQNNIQDQSLQSIQIFFPDPWPKRKHHKRRLIQPELVALLAKKLPTGGTLHIATDWEDYAKHIIWVLSQNDLFCEINATRSHFRPLITKFEQRGKDAGRKIWDLQYVKKELTQERHKLIHSPVDYT